MVKWRKLWRLVLTVNWMLPKIIWEEILKGSLDWGWPVDMVYEGFSWMPLWSEKIHPQSGCYCFLDWTPSCVRLHKASWVPSKQANKDPHIILSLLLTMKGTPSVPALCPHNRGYSLDSQAGEALSSLSCHLSFYQSSRNETWTDVNGWSLWPALAAV